MDTIWQEQIAREVTRAGNGAHVFVPREWVGERIVIVKLPKYTPQGILQMLDPHLPHIIGVFLFGSRARGEARDGADIDLLVITDRRLDIRVPGHHIIAATKESFGSLFKIEPLLLSAVLAEAVPIINMSLLEELRRSFPPKPFIFRPFLKETERIITIYDGLRPSPSDAAYSLVFRLRGVYIINHLLAGRPYSHRTFKLWLKSRLPRADLDALFAAYNAVKDNRRLAKVSRNDAAAAFALLIAETASLKKVLYGQQEKTPEKKH